jgi:hypothetical protein
MRHSAGIDADLGLQTTSLACSAHSSASKTPNASAFAAS